MTTLLKCANLMSVKDTQIQDQKPKVGNIKADRNAGLEEGQLQPDIYHGQRYDLSSSIW